MVSVFATGAGAAAQLKAAGYDIVSVVAMTDSFAHRFWVHESTDLFLVTSPAASESVRRYWPEAQLRSSPPRPPGVLRRPVPAGGPRAPRCPPGRGLRIVHVGGLGTGAARGAATELAQAVSGFSPWPERTRRWQPAPGAGSAYTRVMPFGYTDRVPELMAASDVVVTSSGDTCREARTLGRGIVLLDVVPGHGRENLMHELELGGHRVHADAGVDCPGGAAFVGDPARFGWRRPRRLKWRRRSSWRPCRGWVSFLNAWRQLGRGLGGPLGRRRRHTRAARVVRPHPKCQTGLALSWMASITSRRH